MRIEAGAEVVALDYEITKKYALKFQTFSEDYMLSCNMLYLIQYEILCVVKADFNQSC